MTEDIAATDQTATDLTAAALTAAALTAQLHQWQLALPAENKSPGTIEVYTPTAPGAICAGASRLTSPRWPEHPCTPGW